MRFRLFSALSAIICVCYTVMSQPSPLDEPIRSSIQNNCIDANYKSELILTLNKSHFYLHEPVMVTMIFHNIGAKSDTLPGMLRIENTQAANPPFIWLRSDSLHSNKFLPEIGIPEDLMDSNDIIVLSGDSLILTRYNLDTAFEFQEGGYYIEGGYMPFQQCLGGYIRDSLPFVIGPPTSIRTASKFSINSKEIALKRLKRGVELTLNSTRQNYRSLKVFDASGRTILEKQLIIGRKSQLIDNVPKGILIFDLFSSDDNVQQIKYLHY